MWVPIAVLLLATVLLAAPLRRAAVSESLMAFALTTAAVLVLFQLQRLS